MIIALAFVGIAFMGTTALCAVICYTTKNKAVWRSEPIFAALGMGALLVWSFIGLSSVAWLIESVAH